MRRVPGGRVELAGAALCGMMCVASSMQRRLETTSEMRGAANGIGQTNKTARMT